MRIPQANPLAQYRAHEEEIDNAIRSVLESGAYILGPQVEAFEREFSDYIGCRYGVGVASGTDALHLGLRALDIGGGDEVIAPAHTAVATVAAIEMAGAMPVLADVEPETLTLSPSAVEEAVTERTSAIVAVHLYGHPADIRALQGIAQRHNLKLVEDCAQSAGAELEGKKTGSWGDVASFSFYPTKNLGALGDGGMVLTNDKPVYEQVKPLRTYGWRTRNVSGFPGWNSRLDELQAAVLRKKLPWLDSDNRRRRHLAGIYTEILKGHVRTPTERPGCRHTYHQYVIGVKRRDALMRHLGDRGIGTAVHYPQPIHVQPAYRGRLGREGDFPSTEHAVSEILSLPLYPEMADDMVTEVAVAIRDFVRAVEP